MEDSLKRSLARLGKAAETDMPLIFVEHELSIAIRRFGVKKILVRLLRDILNLY